MNAHYDLSMKNLWKCSIRLIISMPNSFEYLENGEFNKKNSVVVFQLGLLLFTQCTKQFKPDMIKYIVYRGKIYENSNNSRAWFSIEVQSDLVNIVLVI